MVLNRRDASQYRDLEIFLLGLEIFLKLRKFTKFNVNEMTDTEFIQDHKVLKNMRWNIKLNLPVFKIFEEKSM